MAITNDANKTIEFQDEFEVIVVGGGHAGCEAALASARLGCKTLLLTLNLDKIAWQPCNPAVGGPAKSQLTHEIDALGGEMGKVTKFFSRPCGLGIARPDRQAGICRSNEIDR
jgi:tRNA uridine 5-carboxymethylaminomethyl modification enzyme